jgi:microsomal prostaglandin-E synthase 2
MIISALYSYLVDPTKGLAEYLAMYPQIKYIDSDGKTEKTDMSNKYFIMFQELDVQKRKQDVAQERKWRQWVDNTFVHTLSPNVYRTPQE